jgi:O-Antigen ligase
MILVVGYHCFSRAFAYIGIPPAKIFLSEIVLAVAFLVRPESITRLWLGSIVRRSPLSSVALFALALVGYGAWQVVRGLVEGFDVLTTLQTAVFTYYPMYFFLGAWAALRQPGLLEKTLRWFVRVGAVYGVLWVLILAPPSNVYMEDSAGLFGFTQPAALGLALLAILCNSKNYMRDMPLILMISFSVMAMQMRAEWLAVGLGVMLWAILSRRVLQALGVAAAALGLLAMLQVADVKIPGRTGDVTLTETVARLAAPVAPVVAERLSPNATEAEGSANFRKDWWSLIWRAANADPQRFLLGWGLGYPLRGLVYGEDPDAVRSPHNVFFFALGYLGWIGVVLFFGLMSSICLLCWKVFRVTGNPFAFIYCAASLVIGLMGNSFETPYGAIPCYLVCGMAMEPLLRPYWNVLQTQYALPARTAVPESDLRLPG